MIDSIGVPYGNRTRVAAVKGRCPRPLDERDACGEGSSSVSGLRYRKGFVAVKRRGVAAGHLRLSSLENQAAINLNTPTNVPTQPHS